MRVLAVALLGVMITGCASTPKDFNRNSDAWASLIVGCQSAAALGGTDSEKAIWDYEKRALLADRNGGWPSDRARLTRAVKDDKAQLFLAGDAAITRKLSDCNDAISARFPDGHVAA